ncbi:MAG: MATE family efflux transporter [Lachnospiraceae bacterium]|nr:MATE family efflux transporter [Lachnospiraceae bacterium]
MHGVLKKYIKYVSLNIMGTVALALNIFVDALFISIANGADGLTALNLAAPTWGILLGTSFMLGVGGGAAYMNRRATQNKKLANQAFTTAMVFAASISVLFMSLGIFFAPQIAGLFGASGHIFPMTTIYLRTVLIASPVIILSNTLGGIIRNDDAPRVAMAGNILFSFLNIGFDYLFMFIFEMGMFGAALATGLASVFHLLLYLIYWRSKQAKFQLCKFKIQGNMLKSICIMGAPSMIGEFSTAIITTTFNLVILGISGNIGVAAFGILSNLSFILLSIFAGMGQGMQPLASLYYGEKNKKNLQKVFRYSIFTALLLSALGYFTLFGFTNLFVNMFNYANNPILTTLANQGIPFYFIGILFVALNIIITNYLSVTFSPKLALFLSALRGGILVIPLILVLSRFFALTGVWLAYPLSELLTFLIAILCWLIHRRKLNFVQIHS